jgi:hypothetical protein
MNQRPTPTNERRPPHVYTEEERKRRWTLIIDAILNDPGLDALQKHGVTAPAPAQQPKQTT